MASGGAPHADNVVGYALVPTRVDPTRALVHLVVSFKLPVVSSKLCFLVQSTVTCARGPDGTAALLRRLYPMTAHSSRARSEWRHRRRDMHEALAQQPPQPARTFPLCSNLRVEILDSGNTSAKPVTGDAVLIHYACLIAESGRLVDSTRAIGPRGKPFTAIVGADTVVRGMDLGLRQLTLGALARLHVPSDLGYGELGNGQCVPPSTDLVFEIEVIGINERRAKPRRTRSLRALLVTPPHQQQPDSTTSTLTPMTSPASPLVRAPEDEDDDFDTLRSESVASDLQVSPADASARWPWVSRLRPTLTPPLSESASFFALHASFDADTWRHALLGNGRAPASGDGAQTLLPGTLPLTRHGYGARFDSRTPMILTGERASWPGFTWGWAFWAGRYGDDLATAKQRAPIFESDVWADTVVAEASMEEYISYARHAHRQSEQGQRTTPLLYMNGLEIFGAHPELWGFHMEQLNGVGDAAATAAAAATARTDPAATASPAKAADGNLSDSHPPTQAISATRTRPSIDNRTASEYASVWASLGMDASAERVVEETRQYSKLFISPRGAATRMHQDNHHAHAWLSQVRPPPTSTNLQHGDHCAYIK